MQNLFKLFFFHASFISGSNVAFLNLFYVTFFKAVVEVESLGWLNFLIDVVIGQQGHAACEKRLLREML